MVSRREFLGLALGLSLIRGPRGRQKGTFVHKRERPVESVQRLIEQVRSLERGKGSSAHIQAIQDQVRSRLLLSGLACVYVEENGQTYVCTLETRTGCLWCLPRSQVSQSWAQKEFERIGLRGLEGRITSLHHACDI
jgi:hypothetical protein